MSIIGTARELYQVGKEEFQDASLYQRAILGATALTLAFEWGTGNEAVIGISAGHVLQETHNVLFTTATAGGASFLEQAVFGLSAVASIHNFPKFMGAVRSKIFERGEKQGDGEDSDVGPVHVEAAPLIADDIPSHSRDMLSGLGMLDTHLAEINSGSEGGLGKEESPRPQVNSIIPSMTEIYTQVSSGNGWPYGTESKTLASQTNRDQSDSRNIVDWKHFDPGDEGRITKIVGKYISHRRNKNNLGDKQTPTEENTNNRRQTLSRIGGRFLTAVTFGTSIVAMKNNAVKEHSIAENSRNVILDAGYIGAGVAVIGAIAGSATVAGRAIGLQTEANIFVDIMTNPGTYVGLFSIKALLSYSKNHKRTPEHIETESAE